MAHRKQIGAPEPSFLQKTWGSFLDFWKWALPSCTTATEVVTTTAIAASLTVANGGGPALNEMVLPNIHNGIHHGLTAGNNFFINQINGAISNNTIRLEDHPEIRGTMDRVEDTIGSVIDTTASASKTLAETTLNVLRSPKYVSTANKNIDSTAESVKNVTNNALSHIEHELIEAESAGGMLPYAIENTANFIAKNVDSFLPAGLIDAHSAVTTFLEEALGLNNDEYYYGESSTSGSSSNNNSFLDYMFPFGEVGSSAWEVIGEIGKHIFYIQ